MKRNNIRQYVSLLICVAVIVAQNSGCRRSSERTTRLPDLGNTKIPYSSVADICDHMAGAWSVHRGPKEFDRKKCRTSPCGFDIADFVFNCKEHTLSGKYLLGVDSDSNPPIARFATISTTFDDGNLILTYDDGLCKYAFRATEVEKNAVFGDWQSSDCKLVLLPFQKGGFALIRK